MGKKSDLYRGAEEFLRPGHELLQLSGGDRGLPHRRIAGSGGQQEEIPLLRGGVSCTDRRSAGRLDKALRRLKYVFLVVFVLLLPAFLKVNNGLSSVPYFCKLVCPVGILEGAIPLAVLDEGVRGQLGLLFHWKLLILILIVVLSMVIHRPFCKYVCPLGAFYGLFQRVSFLQLKVDREKCTGCGACSRQCGMNVDVVHNPNSAECIRCGACTKACPSGALHFNIRNQKNINDQNISDQNIGNQSIGNQKIGNQKKRGIA